MKELKYLDIKQDLYLIREDGAIYSKYKKDYMNPIQDKDGYLKINLRKTNGGIRSVRIASLVAFTFLGEPVGLLDPTVNHKDGNILNNHYTNLEWLERGENSSIRFNTGQGSKNSQAKLTEQNVEQICKLLLTTSLTCLQIANIFNVSESTINNILHKKNWKTITASYDFSKRKKIKNISGKFIVINEKEGCSSGN